MILASFDPSSSCLGYAIFEWNKGGDTILQTSGQIKYPPKAKMCMFDKVEKIKEDVYTLVTDRQDGWGCTHAVYELPDKCNRGYANSTPYYQAVIAVQVKLWEMLGPERCTGVPVQLWKGSRKKEITIKEVNESYDLDLTMKENDEADAIGLGDKYLHKISVNKPFEVDK